MVPKPSLRNIARSAAALAGLTGAIGFLSLMGAFGPVSCWTSRSGSSEATSGGEVTTTTTEVARGCEAGIDYFLGSASGNAPVLVFWAVVLVGLVSLGGAAVWTGRRRTTWATAVVGAVISVIGLMSIGWYFMLPTLFLLVAAATLTTEVRRNTDGRPSTEP